MRLISPLDVRLRWLVFAALALTACKRSPVSDANRATPSASAEHALDETSLAPSASAARDALGATSERGAPGASSPAPPLLEESEQALGFAKPPTLPQPAAQQQNDLALAALRAMNLEAAEQAARQALAIDESYDLGRFNLACILTRRGALAGAVAELDVLLKRDLPRFYPRLLADADLGALRDSPEGGALLARTQRLEVTWMSRSRQGVPVNAWVPHIPIQGDQINEYYHSRPELLRTGVWLAKEKRFLPLGPEQPKMLAALIDPLTGRGVSVVGKVDPCLSDMCPRLGKVDIVVHASLHPAKPSMGAPRVVFSGKPDEIHTWLGVELSAGDVRWTEFPEHGPWFSARTLGSLQAETPLDKPVSNQLWLGGEQLEVGPLGTRASGLPVGFHGPAVDCYYRGCKETLQLPDGRKLELEALFDGVQSLQVVLAPPHHAVVVGNWPECVCGEGERPDLHHQIAILDLENGKLTPWLKGTLSAAARVGPDRGIYVQQTDGVQRFKGIEALTNPEALPRGLVLTPPEIQSQDCCGL